MADRSATGVMRHFEKVVEANANHRTGPATELIFNPETGELGVAQPNENTDGVVATQMADEGFFRVRRAQR